MRVFCYRNLHTGKISVRALDGEYKGRVIAHADIVQVAGAIFKVSEKGRQRVIKERQKNVHAGVQGELTWMVGATLRHPIEWVGDPENVQPVLDSDRVVGYNPYKFESFVLVEHGNAPIHEADHATVSRDGKVKIT